jgi:hypothetical protein
MCLCVPEDPDTYETRGGNQSLLSAQGNFTSLGTRLSPEPECCLAPHTVRSYKIILHRSTDCWRRIFEGVLLPRRRVGDSGKSGHSSQGSRELLFGGDHKCVPFSNS